MTRKEILLPTDSVSDEEAIRSWDEAAEEFAGLFERDDEFYYKSIIDPALLDLLVDIEGKTVLDLACGEGRFSRKLAERANRNVKVTGIDASEAMIKIAHKRNESFADCISFQVGEASRMAQLPSNSFDIVVCNMALMMIKRYDGAIKEVARVLKPEGVFVFSITHPCFWTPGCEWIVADTEGTGREEKIGWKVDNYHLKPVSRWVITGCSQKETYLFYRTLEDYFGALRKGGFVVVDLREPLPPKELMEKDPQYEAELKRSVFLVIKSVLLET